MCVCGGGGGGGGGGVASYLAINELLSVLKNQLRKGVWGDTMSGQKPLLQIEEIA